MSVSVRDVAGDRDFARFIRFPFRLYRGNRYWVPPLLQDERSSLDPRKNPAFEHCRVRLLLAEEDGRLIGRVAAIINDRYIRKWGNKYCRFGWLDFIDDARVPAALLGAVEAWARENGRARLLLRVDVTQSDLHAFCLALEYEQFSTSLHFARDLARARLAEEPTRQL